jgi:hypothetical protein
METITKPKQGKLDLKKIAKGLKLGMKKKDIAVYAGSLAVTDGGKITSVNKRINSDEFQSMMAEKVKMAGDSMTQEKLEQTNAVGLATIIDKLSRVSGLATVNPFSDNPNTTINADHVLIQYGIDVNKLQGNNTSQGTV